MLSMYYWHNCKLQNFHDMLEFIMKDMGGGQKAHELMVSVYENIGMKRK